MKSLFLTMACLALTGALSATDIKPKENGFAIVSPSYSTFVSGNGSLSSLKIAGIEFLNARVSISRGAYFYQDGVVDMGMPIIAGASTVVAEGAKSKLSYLFMDQSIRCRLENKTDKPMSFFFVLSSKAKAALGPDRKWTKAPLAAEWKSGSWFLGEAKLAFQGITRVWGPWDGGTQVVECILDGRKVAEVIVTAGKASPDEISQATRLNMDEDYSMKDLAVLSPRNLQVFQRRTLEVGEVVISGRAFLKHDKIEYLLEGVPFKGKLPPTWQPLEDNPIAGAFHSKMDLPAGGWYKLTVRLVRSGEIVASQTVEKFGVGEVFVTAGQSNSTNCGQFRTKQTTGMVSSFNGTEWRLADDPQPGAHDNSQGGSPWPAFGDAMAAKYKVPIGIAVTGHGGTSVNQWQPGDELHNWMMGRISQLGVGGFRAVLWHQGEADVQMAPEEYVQKMTKVINASTKMAGWQFPWIVAQASYHNADHPSWPGLRAAQKMLWDRGIALEGPDTDTLTGDHRDYDGKGIHFSPKGLKAHGEMWANCVQAYLDKVFKKQG